MGKSFHFELNGIPVFAKGANYIPQDLFLPRVSDSKYRSLIASAKDANMNMLRIWGGGIYEKDIFYDLCDEAGILVWQDFMFACSMYPNTESLLDNIRLEAEENVKKLRNYASIALWCGNNEIDVAWQQYDPEGGWGWKQLYNEEQKAEIWQAYDTVFHHILPAAVAEHDPQKDYWPSSPMAGPREHYTYESTSGDVHYWGVWHGLHPFEAFDENIGRFMSEYGFQSFPEFATVKKFTIPEDWDIESEVMTAHQRSGIGNLRIRQYMEQYYQLPDNFEDMLYVGQVLQGEGMKMGFEAHRRAMPYNMGSLYWQINDCWPVASWAGMDYYQNWKAMHYMAKKAFAPLLVSPYEADGKLIVSVISDRVEPVSADLQLVVMDFDGNPIWKDERPIEVNPLVAEVQYEVPIDKIIAPDLKSASFVQVSLVGKDGAVLADNEFFFGKTKDLQLPVPAIEKSVAFQDDQWVVTVRSEQLVKNLWLQFEGVEGRFSDNYFNMLPGKTYSLTFETASEEPLNDKMLGLRSIRDMYE